MSANGTRKRWSEVVNGHLLEIEQVGDKVHLRAFDENGRVKFSQTVTAREFKKGLRSRRQ